MKYALIGCGRISVCHIDAAKKNGLDIVALCDTDTSAAEARRASSELGDGVRIFSSHKELLEVCHPELVAVATESGAHASIALDCIDAGCNVIIEKPIALSMSDAREIIRRSAERGICVSVNHQNRFNLPVQKLRGALEDGRFGRLLYGTANIRWYRDRAYYKSADWRGTWAHDGGALMNQCIHDIDLLRWMMGGSVTEVCAYTDRMAHGYIEAEDLGIAIVRFANGAYGTVEGTTDTFPRDLEETLYISGENGYVRVGGTSLNKIEAWRFGDESENEADIAERYGNTPKNVYGFGHGDLYADVIEAINTGREPYVTATDGMNALEMVLAIYKSAAEGKPVALPLGDCSTTDFTGRFAH